MKILVPVKRVIDYEAKIKVKSDGSGVETEGVKMIVNPFDEIAVEEALKLKEAGKAEEVVVVSCGDEESVQQLRYAMAMGADRAILVKCPDGCDSDLASRILKKVYERENPGLVLLGKQAIDSDAGQTPQLLAERLSIGHASFASKIELEGGSVTVTREIDGGLETVKIPTPCVVSTDLRLNEPRYAPLPGIMKAKKKPLEELSLEDLGVDGKKKVVFKQFLAPPARAAGRKVDSVDELLTALREEAKVIP